MLNLLERVSRSVYKHVTSCLEDCQLVMSMEGGGLERRSTHLQLKANSFQQFRNTLLLDILQTQATNVNLEDKFAAKPGI